MVSYCSQWFPCKVFQSPKGVRQDDPMSTYLFALGTEVLSQLLNEAAREGKMGYPPRCKRVLLTHLCFVDHLMVFTDGRVSSTRAIMEVLDKFYKLPALKLKQKFLWPVARRNMFRIF
ncbi:hypothetical protein CDL15_Pgr018403 [Punica granatum]|uniref:Reverse transcriptase domain-containing protein n=1 Tax=Punica granatum TaxID=22663 RepID=A0A218W229_PUNGR|nr:hypothetical protein CDL15_Pgr018403 [Punica granatum]